MLTLVFNTARRTLLCCLLTGFLLTGISAHAQSAKSPSIAADALTCAGLYSLLTSLSPEYPDFGDVVTRISMMFQDVLAYHDPEISNQLEMQEQLAGKRKVLRSHYEDNPRRVFATYTWCDKWRAVLAVHIQEAVSGDASTGKDVRKQTLDTVPLPPEPLKVLYSQPEEVEWLVRTAFDLGAKD